MDCQTPLELVKVFESVVFIPLVEFNNDLTHWVNQISKFHECMFTSTRTGKERPNQIYSCTFGGTVNSETTLKGTTKCPAYVIFSINGEDKDVNYSEGFHLHNHPTTKRFINVARTCLTDKELEYMNYLQSIGLGPGKIRAIMDLSITPQHFYDARRSTIISLKFDQIPLLLSTIQKWKGWKCFTHYTQVNDIRKLCSISIINIEIMNSIFSRDIAIIDDTACTNMYGLNMECIMVMDYNGRSHVLAFGAIPDQSSEGFKLFFRDVKEFTRIEFRLMVMDRSAAQLNAIREIYPNSKYIFCIIHIQRNIVENLNGEVVQMLTKLLNGIITEEVFHQYISLNIFQFTEKSIKYIADLFLEVDHWSPERTKFLLPFGNETSNRAEGLFGNFKPQICNRTSSLLQIFTAVARLEELAMIDHLKSNHIVKVPVPSTLLAPIDSRCIGDYELKLSLSLYDQLRLEFVPPIEGCVSWNTRE